jgi:DNA invertase Pin-like site-specific DNA recombinase
MLIGYARVSTVDQTLALQQDALVAAGCEKIFTETASGTTAERIVLQEALDYAREGDLLVVWRLDRLCRSAKDALTIADNLHKRNIGLKILTGRLTGSYTPSGEGKFFFTLMAAVAELEHSHILERTHAGLAAARARGRVGGRPRAAGLNTPQKVQMAKAIYQDKNNSVAEICRTLRISRTTLYRYMKD